MIYRRFTEKSAEEWRQIYKALQLLEFLIKHGSERVIDDARGHITLLKMLRQFHYIDPNGKDQGINVRNRAKELSDLLGDVEKIRSERKKARANKAKYTGVEGGGGGGFSSGSSGRYGGFGSESGGYGGGGSGPADYGGYSGGVYGDGGGFGGQTDDWRDNGASSGGGGGGKDRFEEYDAGDDASASSTAKSKRPERTERAGVKKTVGATEPPKKKEPEVDLFSFDDPVPASSSIPAAAPQTSNGSSSAFGALSEAADDDDFDDFQSAPPTTSNFGGSSTAPPMMTSNASATAQFVAPKPVSAPQQASMSGLMSSISPPPLSSGGTPGANYSAFSAPMSNPMASMAAAPAQKAGMGYQAAQPNYFQSVSAQPQQGGIKPGMSTASGSSTPSGMSALNKPAAPAAKPATSGGADPFANLWGASGGAKKTPAAGSGPKMGDLAKEKTSASLWGAPAAAGAKNNNSGGFGDLL